jgi:hypothetical protein
MIKTKIKNNIKHSLLVFCLIIGAFFVTNINNNVLAIDTHNSKMDLSEMVVTDENKDGVINCIIQNISVDYNKDAELQDYLSTLYQDKGWKVKDTFLTDKNDTIVYFAFLLQNGEPYRLYNKACNRILDYKSLNNENNNYPAGTTIILSTVARKTNNKKFDYNIYSINKDLNNATTTKESLTNIAMTTYNYWIFLEKFYQNKEWHMQFRCIGKNSKYPNRKIIIERDIGQYEAIKQELEKIWNNSACFYNDAYPFVNPYNTQQQFIEQYIRFFMTKIDAQGLDSKVLEEYIKKGLIQANWLMSSSVLSANTQCVLSMSGREWETIEHKILLFPTNLRKNTSNHVIYDGNNIKEGDKIIFQYIDYRHFYPYNFYHYIVKTPNKLGEITKKILAQSLNQLTWQTIYLIQRLKQQRLTTYLHLCHFSNALKHIPNSSIKIAITEEEFQTIIELSNCHIFDIYQQWGINKTIQDKKE